MRVTTDYPPIWLAGFVALGWGAGKLWPLDFTGRATLGAILVIVALALMAVAVMEIRAKRTTLDPHGKPSGLVTVGVYRLSRNPIYLADLILLAGLCLLLRAPLVMPLLVAALAMVLTHRFIRPEEARLKALFGMNFTSFAERTRRWL